MSRKFIIFIVAIAVFGILFWWSGLDSQNNPEPVPDVSTMQETPAASFDGEGFPVIRAAIIVVQGDQGEDLGELRLEAGVLTPLPGTELSLQIAEFYTHWNWDDGAINLSMHESNPAVRIEVVEGGEVIYYGWAFRNMEFFRMAMHSGAEEVVNRLAFTLRSYEGLHFHEGDVNTGEEG